MLSMVVVWTFGRSAELLIPGTALGYDCLSITRPYLVTPPPETVNEIR